MEWINKSENLPIKSWCKNVENKALNQAKDLANHPAMFHHIALMPDCHMGYGMPIGGVIGCKDAIIPNAVGVDIGCGMGAIETNFSVENIKGKKQIRQILEDVKAKVPLGEGHSHREPQAWEGFIKYKQSIKRKPGWLTDKVWDLAKKNLGSLGGGNHFIELQESEDGKLWLMLHSGSRNLGYKIAEYYNREALLYNEKKGLKHINKDLAYLPLDYKVSTEYIRDMTFAMEYALENRYRMIKHFKESVSSILHKIDFGKEINIHHNYASLEKHFGKNIWIHRKGATSANKGEVGIIPGSMGTSSYIVEGLGNKDSFHSCSHGAGRKMSRTAASKEFTAALCDKAMGDVVYDQWKISRYKKKGKRTLDLSEAPLAYKDIEEVINSQLDLIKPIVKLNPLGVVKG